MAETKQKHIHKFKRLKYKSGSVTFFCALPDCTVKMNPSLALGKRSICWRCNEEFIMTEYSLRLAKPHCDKCHKSKHGMIAREEAPSNAAMSLAERLQNTITNSIAVLPQEIEDEI